MIGPEILKGLKADYPPQPVLDILGDLPNRWGRMDLSSRLVVVAVGDCLRQNGLLDSRNKALKKLGLVMATTSGSLATDRKFFQSVEEGWYLASPALFGYTLPNIPLSEAAIHYGLFGPVFAIYEVESPSSKAQEIAQDLLLFSRSLELEGMLFGSYEVPSDESYEKIKVEVDLICA